MPQVTSSVNQVGGTPRAAQAVGAFYQEYDVIELHNDANQEAGWAIEYRQREAGPYSGYHIYREGEACAVMKESHNVGIDVEGVSPDNMITAVLTASQGRHAEDRGRPLGSEGMVLLAPGGNLHGMTFGQTIAYSLYLDLPAFRTAYGSLYPEASLPLPEKGHAHIACDAERNHALRAAIDASLTSDNSMNRGRDSDSYLQELLADAIASSSDAPLTAHECPHHDRGTAAGMARAFIDAHYTEPLTMAELCRHSRVGVRTLQRGFIERFEMTPMQYLKVRRLNAAHQKLLRARPDNLTVTEVAFQQGVTHLGRFSRDYKRQFHELPRITLLR